MTINMRQVVAALCCLAVAACAGSVSEGEYGLQTDGSFNLTPAEQAEACDGVRQKMRNMADETVALDLQSSQEVASSIMWGLLFGVAGAVTYRMSKNAGEAGKKARRNRAKMVSYNHSLRAKGCETWDYEAHMNNKRLALRAKQAELRRNNPEIER